FVNKATVASIGRPNVGKSTIFKRLIGERVSVVEDKPGITRDRIYREAEWLSSVFNIVVTGGIDISDEHFIMQIRHQADRANEEEDVVVFLVDGRTGITAADEEVGKILYKSKKPVVLGVNKVDNPEMQENTYEFYALGFGTPYPISGSHGLGLGDLLDEVVALFPEQPEEEKDEDTIYFSVIGRPNVGKSSLVNAMLNEDSVIVSDVEGTTRDAVDSHMRKDDQDFVIIDTAGIRKRGKVYESTEKYSVLRALKAIDRSDVVLVLIDAETGIREQDKTIAGYAHD